MRGVSFNNAYTTCPVCSPARSSLLAGVYHTKTGIETNIYQPGCRTHELQDTDTILSRRLQKAGYNISYTGKWHLGVGADKTTSGEGKPLINMQKHGYMDGGAYINYGTLPTDVGFISNGKVGMDNLINSPNHQEILYKLKIILQIG